MTKTEIRINNLTRKACASEWMPDENHYEPGYLSDKEADLLINVCLAHKYTCKEFDRLLHTTQIDGTLGYCLVLEYNIRSLDDNSALTDNPKAALAAWYEELRHDHINTSLKGKFRVTSCNDGAFTIIDSVGGQHSEGLGWHPSGEFCGECSSTNCSTCNYYKAK